MTEQDRVDKAIEKYRSEMPVTESIRIELVDERKDKGCADSCLGCALTALGLACGFLAVLLFL